MSLRGTYLTPDTPLSGVEYDLIVLRVPRISEITRALRGSFLSIAYPYVWTAEGTMSPEDTAQEIKEVINSWSSINWMLGLAVPVYTSPIPDNLIVADGQTVARDDFPDLWEITPSGMRTPTTLTVPDLRERFILASGTSVANNSTGGETEHQLTEAEMPSHTHSWSQYTFGVDIESVGVPDPTGVGQPQLPEQTGSAGGDQAHNNMPPYYAMVYCIIGRMTL